MTQRTFALLVWLFVPGAAFGQTVVGDSSEFPTDHPIVYVVDSAGQETSGRLQRTDVSSLTIRGRDGDVSFDLRELQAVYRRGDSVWSGAMGGAVIGAVLGALTALNMSCGPLLGPYQRCNAAESTVIIGFATGVGAGIGIGLDALVHGRTQIYPSLSRHSAGALISTEW